MKFVLWSISQKQFLQRYLKYILYARHFYMGFSSKIGQVSPQNKQGIDYVMHQGVRSPIEKK